MSIQVVTEARALPTGRNGAISIDHPDANSTATWLSAARMRGASFER
jgi:hypothetical protein